MKRSVKISRKGTNASALGIGENGRKGYYGSDNLCVNLSMSPPIFSKSVKRYQPKSEKSRPSPTNSTKRVQYIERARPSRSGPVTSGIPEDVAVHFGNFYGHGALSTKGEGNRGPRTTESEFPASETTRFEFTQQMVHELERLAGTNDYARQVSALLDSTVESPSFALNPPPADNFVPYQNSESSDYPLWYKEPDKMLSSTNVNFTAYGNQTKKPNKKNTAMNSLYNIASGSRGSGDVTDCENNDESSSESSSELTSISDANAEEDSDCKKVKVSIIVNKLCKQKYDATTQEDAAIVVSDLAQGCAPTAIRELVPQLLPRGR